MYSINNLITDNFLFTSIKVLCSSLFLDFAWLGEEIVVIDHLHCHVRNNLNKFDFCTILQMQVKLFDGILLPNYWFDLQVFLISLGIG